MVRLDAWHFTRTLARRVSSESHPLYGEFLSISEWDAEDVSKLKDAQYTKSLSKQALPTPQQQQSDEISQRELGTS